eukprot:Gb_09109 [translate_table: standard]
MGLGLTAITNREGEPRLDVENGEEIRHVQSPMAIVLGDRSPEQPGTLFITTKRLVWLSDVDKQKGYSVDFLSISLHAVSTDPEAYPLPCIYAQIESMETDGYGDELEEPDSVSDEHLDLSLVTEMRLVPSDASTLDNLFRVLCACAELNPEPNGELEGEGDWVFNAEDMVNADQDAEQDDGGVWAFNEEEMANPIGYSNGLDEYDIRQNILELRIDDQRFEDAPEMEHETPKSKN